jgi:ankyrin repeat protein
MGGIFEYLCDRSVDLQSERGMAGNILQTAAYLGCYEEVERILDMGFDINSYSEPGGSALMLALQRFGGDNGIGELLISRGADVKLNISPHGTALHVAAWNGHEKMTRMLLDAGADVNAGGGEYGSALQAAVSQGRQLITLLLIDRGADVNLQGGKYGNALQAAQAKGHEQLAELLLLLGARMTQV